jgi:osmotically inducible protein OsmC
MSLKRTAKAHWSGTFKEGKGELTTQSTTLNNTQYSFKTRFESGVGTNPEELVAAAHAGCFTMAIGYGLSEAGFTPGDINTEAVLDLDLTNFTITHIQLNVTATKIEGVSEDKFKEIAEDAKAHCIISRALSVPISMSYQYV